MKLPYVIFFFFFSSGSFIDFKFSWFFQITLADSLLLFVTKY